MNKENPRVTIEEHYLADTSINNCVFSDNNFLSQGIIFAFRMRDRFSFKTVDDGDLSVSAFFSGVDEN